jgi:serine/threonine protein kinase
MSEETIFAVALEKRSPAERKAYLDEACGKDLGLRGRVEALLKSHDKAGSYLERPAVEQLAPAAGNVTRTEPRGSGGEDALAFLEPSDKPGSLGRLGHYEVFEVLGQGGCGTVVRAFDDKLHRPVAIKIMSAQLAATSPPRKRFLREARSAAKIRHENVVGIYDVEDKPIPYLVMEFIAGETLQQRLDRIGPLPVPEVLRIGEQIAAGLAAAHALGLIHRDIKPANVLLESGARHGVKITDFGLARAVDDASLTQSGLIAGTPMYMAPEQAQGEAIDQRADLFSLGSVLYVMCSGRPPFRASTTLAVLKRVSEHTPRPIREIIPEVPNWLCAIVARLHAKNPADRFASAQEVAALLGRHLEKLRQDRTTTAPAPASKDTGPGAAAQKSKPIKDSRPTVEERPASAPPPRPAPRHRRRLLAAAIVGSVVVAAALTLVLINALKTGVIPDVAVGPKQPGDQPQPAAGPGKDKPADVALPKTAPPLELAHVPADAGAALVLRPRRILQSPVVAGVLPPGAGLEMVKGLGIDPERLEQVIVFLDGPAQAAPVAPPPKDDGALLDSKEGRFSVRFPVEPKPSQRKTTLGIRQVFSAEVNEGKMTFELSYVDFPKDSPFVGEQSRVDFATRALEFKPGFKDKKDLKLDDHLGAEVVVDDTQLKTYAVHRVFVAGDRLYQLEATARNVQERPAEFNRFLGSFRIAAAAPVTDAAATPLPGAVLRFAEPVNGKQVLTRLLKGLREERRDGKTYYRSSTGESLGGLPLAGALPDEWTVLVAPEPVLAKMLAAGATVKSPLCDRLRQIDDAADISGVVLVEPYRKLLKAMVGQFAGNVPPNLAEAASLPDRVDAMAVAVHLGGKTLVDVSLDADNEQSAAVLDDLAFKGLTWARQAYPALRPTLLRQIPAEVVQPALAVTDQVFGGVQVAKEGKRLVVRLEKPEGFDTPPDKYLIASSGFNNRRGLHSTPVPGFPFLLDTPNRDGGDGEPGWKGPWLAHPDAVFQSKVVFEGDGALRIFGRPNFGPNYLRQLAQAQAGKFQVEFYLQLEAGGSIGGYLWQDRHGGADRSGPTWGAGGGRFSVWGYPDTGFKVLPGRWYKVTFRIDVPKQTWEFFLDDKRFESPKPLQYRAKVEYLDVINFLGGEGVAYIDALRVTRLPGEPAPPTVDSSPKDATAPAPLPQPVALKQPHRLALPSPATDMTGGGAGKYLIVHLGLLRKTAVVNVAQMKIQHYVPLGSDTARVAAGLDKLVVVNFDAKKIQRWGLDKGDLELEADLPKDHPGPGQVAMGSASHGPVLLGPGLKLFDLQTLQPLTVPIKHQVNWASPNAELGMGVRASADGTAFGFWKRKGRPQYAFSMIYTGTQAESFISGGNAGHITPGCDGRILYSGRGLLDTKVQAITAKDNRVEYCVPAQQPGFWFVVKEVRTAKSPVLLYSEGSQEPFATLTDIEHPAAHEWDEEEFNADRKMVLLPFYGLLVTLPRENELVFHPVDVAALAARAGVKYLVVLSQPPAQVERGRLMTYQVQGRSSTTGGIGYRLESGPPAMTVTAQGLLSWRVPSDFPDRQATVIVALKDAAGLEKFHSFSLTVAGEPPVVVAKSPEPKKEIAPKKEAPENKGAQPDPGRDWKEFPHPEGGFVARFPSAPKITSAKTKEGLTGRAEAELPGGGHLEVSFNDFDQAVAAAGPEFFLDAMAKQMNPSKRVAVKVGAHSGLDLEMTMKDETVYMRLVMVKQRLYQATVAFGGGKKDAALAGAFLRGFRPTGTAATAKDTPPPSKEPKDNPPPAQVPIRGDREQALAWVREHNDFGPNHQLVKDVQAFLGSLPGPEHGFKLVLGPDLVKSGKATILLGWRHRFWAFELTAAQSAKLNKNLLTRTTLNPSKDAGEVRPDFALSAPVFDAGPTLPADRAITGRLPFRNLGREALGYPSIRLTHWTDVAATTSYSHYLSKFVGKDDKEFKFKFDSPKTAGLPPDPMVLVFDIVEFPDEGRTGDPFVVSDPVAILVNVSDKTGQDKNK